MTAKQSKHDIMCFIENLFFSQSLKFFIVNPLNFHSWFKFMIFYDTQKLKRRQEKTFKKFYKKFKISNRSYNNNKSNHKTISMNLYFIVTLAMSILLLMLKNFWHFLKNKFYTWITYKFLFLSDTKQLSLLINWCKRVACFQL